MISRILSLFIDQEENKRLGLRVIGPNPLHFKIIVLFYNHTIPRVREFLCIYTKPNDNGIKLTVKFRSKTVEVSGSIGKYIKRLCMPLNTMNPFEWVRMTRLGVATSWRHVAGSGGIYRLLDIEGKLLHGTGHHAHRDNPMVPNNGRKTDLGVYRRWASN